MEHWQNGNVIINCLIGLDRVKRGAALPETLVLECVELLRKDLTPFGVTGHAQSSPCELCKQTESFYVSKGLKSSDVADFSLALIQDMKNLANIAVLGSAFGDWERAKEFCTYLHEAELALSQVTDEFELELVD